MDLSNKKILVRTKELLEKTSISQTTLSFWIFQFKRGGRDLREMGCYQLKGSRYDLWDLTQFISYMENEKLEVRPPNTKHEVKRIRQSSLLVNINNKQKRTNYE
jgi:transposase-like protein